MNCHKACLKKKYTQIKKKVVALIRNTKHSPNREVSLNDPPIDVAISPHGSYVFILTKKAVLVYALTDEKIVNRIPVDKAYDKVSFSKTRNEFILTSTASKSLDVIKIYPSAQINIDGLPY